MTNQVIHANVGLLKQSLLPGVRDIVPTYGSLTIVYDPNQLDYFQVEDWLLTHLSSSAEVTRKVPETVEIPVVYGGDYGPDLGFVAQHNHLTEAEVIRIHSERIYPVYMMGFTPGFPYLGGLDPAIATPRLKEPRQLIRAGSVGIANKQTGVYPQPTPGGWQLIGWTPLKLFDITKASPCLIGPGNLVRFVPISIEEAERVAAASH